jgi:hypothetical protein
MAACPPDSTVPDPKPEIVAWRFATCAPDVLAMRNDTYIACGPLEAGELLSSVSAESLVIATVSGSAAAVAREGSANARASTNAAHTTR